MNRHVNAIAGRLSLRPPQRHSLEILDRITEIAPPKKGAMGSELPMFNHYTWLTLGNRTIRCFGCDFLLGCYFLRASARY